MLDPLEAHATEHARFARSFKLHPRHPLYTLEAQTRISACTIQVLEKMKNKNVIYIDSSNVDSQFSFLAPTPQQQQLSTRRSTGMPKTRAHLSRARGMPAASLGAPHPARATKSKVTRATSAPREHWRNTGPSSTSHQQYTASAAIAHARGRRAKIARHYRALAHCALLSYTIYVQQSSEQDVVKPR